jgi:hypothetical protein
MRVLISVLVAAAVSALAGCDRQSTATTARPSATRPGRVVTPTEPAPVPPSTTHPAPVAAPTEPAPAPPHTEAPPAKGSKPAAAETLKADPDAVSVAPGKEATVTLTGVPAGANMTATVEPADSKITAVPEHDKLTIKADKGAKGPATVTVHVGDRTARIQVKVTEK